MAILQISKIQQRAGNLVDLPQLDDAEFGWASDTKRLFIGKTTPNENIEVLTSYSDISFSQIDGSWGNLNINPVSVDDGQVLTYDGTNWVNRGGLAGGTINLGTVSNVKIAGGSIGYVLETDGLGNLNWSPKGTLYSNILSLSTDTPIIMRVATTTPYVNNTAITISGVSGTGNGNINSHIFYVQLSVDYPTSGNVELYTTLGNSSPADGTGITYTNSPNAIATAQTSGSGSGNGAQGSNTMIQFNNNNLLDGSANLTYDFSTNPTLTLVGNANISNLNATGSIIGSTLVSNIANGTAPITVTSKTRVPNLNVAYANVTDYTNITTATTGSFYPVLTNALSGNVAQFANSGITFDVTTGTIGATALTGALTTASQPNVTTLGTLTALNVNGTITASAVTANTGVFTGNGSGLSALVGANVTGAVPYAGIANSVAGANVSGAVAYATTANSVAGANVSGTVASATVAASANSVAGANVSGTVASATLAGTATIANSVAGANVSGQVANALVAGTVYTAAQANITSVGTLSSLTVTANVATGGIKTDNYYYANGVSISFAGAYSNSNVSAYLPTYVGNVGAANGATIFNGTTLSTGANTTAGSITGNWTLTSGSKLQSTYADLAEYYCGDKTYEAGTVLEFGGEQEVTIASIESNRVAGVVSAHPAYVMNGMLVCTSPAVIALQGRVPCKVRGNVSKGDMMVSAGEGFAKASDTPKIGTVIGKSLVNFTGTEGIIEVAVGRL